MKLNVSMPVATLA